MSGDVQARSGGSKLRNRNKKRFQDDLKAESCCDDNLVNGSGSDVKEISKQSQKKNNKKSKNSSNSRKTSKPIQPVYYDQELSDDNDGYDYDIAAPMSRRPRKTSCIGLCFKTLVLVSIASSIGMGGLYLHNPKEFWSTVDKAEAYLKPLGANALWPDFQGIQHLNMESIQSLLDTSKANYELYVAKPIQDQIIPQIMDVVNQFKEMIGMKEDQPQEPEKVFEAPKMVEPKVNIEEKPVKTVPEPKEKIENEPKMKPVEKVEEKLEPTPKEDKIINEKVVEKNEVPNVESSFSDVKEPPK